jgi:hypothetical protein
LHLLPVELVAPAATCLSALEHLQSVRVVASVSVAAHHLVAMVALWHCRLGAAALVPVATSSLQLVAPRMRALLAVNCPLLAAPDTAVAAMSR